MIFLLTVSTLAALCVGYFGNARVLVVASIGVLATGLVFLAPDNSGFVYALKAAANLAVFEITAVCAMVYFASAQFRSGAERRKAGH